MISGIIVFGGNSHRVSYRKRAIENCKEIPLPKVEILFIPTKPYNLESGTLRVKEPARHYKKNVPAHAHSE